MPITLRPPICVFDFHELHLLYFDMQKLRGKSFRHRVHIFDLAIEPHGRFDAMDVVLIILMGKREPRIRRVTRKKKGEAARSDRDASRVFAGRSALDS